MKRVEDIQKELEEVIQKIKNISSDINELHKEKEESELADFSTVETAAKMNLYKNHYLETEDEAIQRKWLILLFSALFGNNSNIEGALSYIYKIGYSINYQGALKELYTDGINLSSDEFVDIITTLTDNSCGWFFMVDLLLLVEKYLPDKTTGRQYASKLFFLLNISEADIYVIISFVKAVITGDHNYYIGDNNFLPEYLWCYVQENSELLNNIKCRRILYYADIVPEYAEYYYSDIYSQQHICDNDQIEALYYKVSEVTVDYGEEPDTLSLVLEARNNANGEVYFLHCHDFSPLIKEMLVDIECPSKDFGLSCTIPLSCDDDEAFETALVVYPSWNPLVGYYHLKIDSFYDSWNWFELQPQTNPDYSSLDIIELHEKALEENWLSNYIVNMTVKE